MPTVDIITSDLRFPEGPVAMADGSIVLCEIEAGEITRVHPDGGKERIARTGGGPNGLALGPNGCFYVANSGGTVIRKGRSTSIGPTADYTSGSIQRVDPRTGSCETLYTHCDGNRLSAPNDIVFDAFGGFYFTDLGMRWPRSRDLGALFYGKADGSGLVEVAFPVLNANGVALSPDGSVVYVAETETCRIWAFDIESPGVARKQEFPSPHGGRLVVGLDGFQRFDSMAVDGFGNVCAATLVAGKITVVSPDGEILARVAMPDTFTTNICFGGPDLRTAFVTLSGTGRLGRVAWPNPGLALNYQELVR